MRRRQPPPAPWAHDGCTWNRRSETTFFFDRFPSTRHVGAMALEVRVWSLGGSACVVSADRLWPLLQLKKAVQVSTGVPWREQRLVAGTSVLLDDRELLGTLADRVGSTGAASAGMGASGGDDSSSGDCCGATASDGQEQVPDDTGIDLTLVRRTEQQAMWLERVGRLGIMLSDVPQELKSDRELVLTAVRQNEEAFQYADATLQADRSFVLAAVQLNAGVLPYVSGIFRADREVVLAAVSQRGEVLACLGSELRSDREVVERAVRQHGLALRYAAERLRADRGLAIAAVKQNAGAVAYTAEELRDDQEVVNAALCSQVDALGDEAREQRLIDDAAAMDNWLVL